MGHRFRGHGLLFQRLTPLSSRPTGPFTVELRLKPLQQVSQLLQLTLLLKRQLQPSPQGHRIGCTRHQRSQQGEPQPLGLGQSPDQARILLQGRIQEHQATPSLQQLQRLPPWFSGKQQLQLHAHACRQRRRSLRRGIANPPPPGPCLNS